MVLGLLLVLLKDIKMRETNWFQYSELQSNSSELTLVIKELNMCMKNYLNTEMPTQANTPVITSEVKFMLMKMDSLCTRLSNHLGVYQRKFRNEVVGIIKKFRNTV